MNEETISANWWWENIHSGSDAVEAAKWLLSNPTVLAHQDCSFEVAQVCSELISRITGERISPSQGFCLENGVVYGVIGAEWHLEERKND